MRGSDQKKKNEEDENGQRKENREFSFLELLVAHHHWNQRHHCYRVPFQKKEVFICARCLGLYPVLVGTMVLVFSGAVSLERSLSFELMAWGCGVGILDWGVVRLGFWKGNNVLRSLTGALVGGALGLGLPHYFRHPGSSRFWAVVGGLGGTALLVEVVAWEFFDTEDPP
jgi:uncharacterized membrane protein